MSTLKEREAIKIYYKWSKIWAQKVDKMKDGQVLAIFFRLKRQGKI